MTIVMIDREKLFSRLSELKDDVVKEKKRDEYYLKKMEELPVFTDYDEIGMDELRMNITIYNAKLEIISTIIDDIKSDKY